jgi:hypothetical protein
MAEPHAAPAPIIIPHPQTNEDNTTPVAVTHDTFNTYMYENGTQSTNTTVRTVHVDKLRTKPTRATRPGTKPLRHTSPIEASLRALTHIVASAPPPFPCKINSCTHRWMGLLYPCSSSRESLPTRKISSRCKELDSSDEDPQTLSGEHHCG